MAAGTKLVKLLANLGYGTRKQVAMLFREGRVTDTDGDVLYADDQVDPEFIRVDEAPLDPLAGMVLAMHKPVGYTCSTKDPGRVVYDLLPPRFRERSPTLSTVGRLDRDTSGLLLFTDDGGLLHRIVSPKARLGKVYEAHLSEDLRGDEVAKFATGKLMLESEDEPLLPVATEILGPRHARLTLHEGRYHQVRRMFAAVGHHVTALHRTRVGGQELGELPSGEWTLLDADAVAQIFADPDHA